MKSPFGYQKFAKAVKADILIFSRWFVKKRYVDEAHKNNQKVLVFTINTKKEFNKVEKLGIDGIVTDYPDRF